jgi:hypothetical protein
MAPRPSFTLEMTGIQAAPRRAPTKPRVLSGLASNTVRGSTVMSCTPKSKKPPVRLSAIAAVGRPGFVCCALSKYCWYDVEISVCTPAGSRARARGPACSGSAVSRSTHATSHEHGGSPNRVYRSSCYHVLLEPDLEAGGQRAELRIDEVIHALQRRAGLRVVARVVRPREQVASNAKTVRPSMPSPPIRSRRPAARASAVTARAA